MYPSIIPSKGETIVITNYQQLFYFKILKYNSLFLNYVLMYRSKLNIIRYLYSY